MDSAISTQTTCLNMLLDQLVLLLLNVALNISSAIALMDLPDVPARSELEPVVLDTEERILATMELVREEYVLLQPISL